MTYETMRTLCGLVLLLCAVGVLIFVVMVSPLWPRNWGRLSFGILASCSFVNFLISVVLVMAWSPKPYLGFALVWFVPTVCFGIIATFWKWATTPNQAPANQE